MTKKYVMALDAGTTSNRAIIFDENSQIVALSQREFTQFFPEPGWVEHDAEEIWSEIRAVHTGTDSEFHLFATPRREFTDPEHTWTLGCVPRTRVA